MLAHSLAALSWAQGEACFPPAERQMPQRQKGCRCARQYCRATLPHTTQSSTPPPTPTPPSDASCIRMTRQGPTRSVAKPPPSPVKDNANGAI